MSISGTNYEYLYLLDFTLFYPHVTFKISPEGNRRKEIKNEILKSSFYEIKPLTPEDAMFKLQEYPTHNFLAFINVDTNKVNVIYRLKDGKNYGLVEPEA